MAILGSYLNLSTYHFNHTICCIKHKPKEATPKNLTYPTLMGVDPLS